MEMLNHGERYWLSPGVAAYTEMLSIRGIEIVSTVVLLAGMLWYWKSVNTSVDLQIGMTLVIMGGVNNWIDRWCYSGVVDYILTGGLAWNIADAMIWAGVLILAVYVMKQYIRKRAI